MNLAARSPRSPWEVQRAVLFALLLREIKARIGGQWVGAIWTLFEPLAHVALLVTILGVFRGLFVPGVEVPVFLVTGLVPFFLFQHIGFRLMDGIEANRGLFGYRQVKPFDTLLTRAMVEALMNLVVYLVSLSVLAWIGFHVLPAHPLEVMGNHALLIFFATGFGIFAAVISHDRPRLRSLLRTLMLPLYFASGVLFPLSSLSPEFQKWLLLNPLAHFIEFSRAGFLPGYTPAPGVSLVYVLLFSLVLAALAMSLYRADRLRLIAS